MNQKDNINMYKGLAVYFLPEGVLNYFDVVAFAEEPPKKNDVLYSSELHIYLDEKDNRSSDMRDAESKGYTEDKQILDFPVRGRKAVIHIRRRRWLMPDCSCQVVDLHKKAEIANIGEFIKQLPLRYGTKIGSDGHGLSLGQKQRILIARAICKNPDYIFLDEATNSLDANNEHDIMEHLGTFIKGRTAVIIAHRLSTVRTADNIVVIKQGSIVEQGTHEELIARYGIYYSLVRNQLSV